MIESLNQKIQYNGNSSQTVFTFPFMVLEASHVVVITTVIATDVSTTHTLNSTYSVSGTGSPSGYVTFNTAPATGVRVTLKRVVPLYQRTRYENNDRFPAASHEAALDKLTMIAQQLDEKFGRAMLLEEGSPSTPVTFPEPGASKFIRYNSTGTGLEAVDISGTLNTTVDAVQSVTKVGLGVASASGKLRYVNDSIRGLWADTGAQWYALNGDVINVKAFNATGDGTTNDRDAIVAALAALTTGGALYFPPGSYKISASINLPSVDNIRIFGAGRSSHIWNSTANDGIFNIPAGVDGLEIDHLKLSSTGSLNVLGRSCLYFNPNADPTPIKYAKIHHNYFAAASTSGISGNYITDATIVHNTFDNDGGAFGEHGLYFGTSGGSSARNIIAENTFLNTASGNSGGICIAGSQSDHTISQNIIVGWKYGLLINDTSAGSLSSATITGNRIRSQSHDCINFFQSDTVSAPATLTIAGNSLSAAGRNGIRGDWLNDSVISSNLIRLNNESGIRMNKLTGCTVIGNIIRDNDYDSNGVGGDDSSGIRLNTNCAGSRFIGNTVNCSNPSNYQSYAFSIGSSGNTGNYFADNLVDANRVANFDVAAGATGGGWGFLDGTNTFKLGNPGGSMAGVIVGTGAPEGAVTATIGHLYLRVDGSTSTTLYVKTSGSGNTGWTAK